MFLLRPKHQDVETPTFTIFISLIINHDNFDSAAYPSIMHFTYELSLMTLLSMRSPSSVDRAPARCSGGHGFKSYRGLRFYFFAPSILVSCLILPYTPKMNYSKHFTISPIPIRSCW